jgi:hypothetical protein
MDCRFLTGDHLDLSGYRLGAPQQSGCLTVVPITTQRPDERLLFPGQAHNSAGGSSPPPNRNDKNRVLMPLHLEIPAGGRTSRLLPRVEILPSTSGSEGLDLKPFYVPPILWREQAWIADAAPELASLEPALKAFDDRLRLLGLRKSRRPIVHARLPQLQRLSRQIELQSGQTGALFFIEDRPAGLEIAPSPAYFAFLWRPLLLGCYGLTALVQESLSPSNRSAEPYAVSRPAELRTEMFRERHQYQERLEAAVTRLPEGVITSVEEAGNWGEYRSRSLTGSGFAGQYVEEVRGIDTKATDEGRSMPKMLRNLFRKPTPAREPTSGRAVYVSLFARHPLTQL